MESQMLKIDLSNRSYEVQEIPEKIVRHYVGGRGLGAYLLYRLVPPKADPLGEENHLIFTAGPANGTNLPFASRQNFNTKSPLTNIYLYGICGGVFGHQMRKAGFWAIDIRGIADAPVYITINNRELEFRDATPLWGMETAEAQRAMLGGLSAKKAATMAIGPAGEKLIKYAAIFSEGALYRCFGRGGTGCVMGSKKLKGIVISGDGDVAIADKNKFEAVKKAIVEKRRNSEQFAGWWREYGTCGDLREMQEWGIIPTRNWQGGQFEDWARIGAVTNKSGWPRRSQACAPYCIAPCSHYVEINKGPYQGAHCDGPEWETVYAFGSSCGVNKFDAIVAADQICDENGIDTMSAGISIGFAMECFEKGLIGLKDTDGIELRFGNDQAMITMLRKIVNQDGFGRLLGEGVKRMSEEIKGSDIFAMQVKGLELGGYECRGLMGQALQFAIDNRGGCHHGYGLPAREEVLDGTRLNIEGKGEQVKNLAIGRIIRDSIPVCTFPGWIVEDAILAEVASSLIGGEWSVDDLRKVGMRVMCQERLFNMREGIARKDDSLPARLLSEPKPDGPTKGAVVPLEELKEDYYRAMGWNLLTGNPTDSVLAQLEIER